MNRLLPPSPSAMPRKIWLVMTPELPRAPMSAPKLIAAATRSAGWPATASASSSAALTVANMFEPVSPSGTGIDVEAVDLVDVRLEVGDGRPEGLEEPVAVAGASGHLGDVRAAVGEVARAGSPVGESPAATAGSAPPGWTRRPSMWMTSRSTSRSRARRTA